jgi:hypothetical protein
MVCENCEKKLFSLATINDNNKRIYGHLKLESHKKYLNSNIVMSQCPLCGGRAEGKNKYCLTCAHKKGICEMCGKKLTRTSMYRYNDVDDKDTKRRIKAMERSRIISQEMKKERGVVDPTIKKKKRIGKKIKPISNINLFNEESKPKQKLLPLEKEENDIKDGNTNSEDKKEEVDNVNGNIDENDFDEIIQL